MSSRKGNTQRVRVKKVADMSLAALNWWSAGLPVCWLFESINNHLTVLLLLRGLSNRPQASARQQHQRKRRRPFRKLRRPRLLHRDMLESRQRAHTNHHGKQQPYWLRRLLHRLLIQRVPHIPVPPPLRDRRRPPPPLLAPAPVATQHDLHDGELLGDLRPVRLGHLGPLDQLLVPLGDVCERRPPRELLLPRRQVPVGSRVHVRKAVRHRLELVLDRRLQRVRRRRARHFPQHLPLKRVLHPVVAVARRELAESAQPAVAVGGRVAAESQLAGRRARMWPGSARAAPRMERHRRPLEERRSGDEGESIHGGEWGVEWERKGESSLARKRMGVMCKGRRRSSVCFHTAAVR